MNGTCIVRNIKSFIKILLQPLIKLTRYIAVNSSPLTASASVTDLVWDQAKSESAKYIYEHIESAMLFKRREKLWDYVLSRINTEGICAEFGVYSGYSVNYFADIHKNRIFYGFDSFEGLHEDWTGTGAVKGTFDLKGIPPKVRGNVRLIKGWFSQTVPIFFEQANERFAFIHFDADTYESTAYILNAIGKGIGSGTIVIFDEYLGYPNWNKGEFRAWQEFVSQNDIRYRYLGFSNQNVAIEVL